MYIYMQRRREKRNKQRGCVEDQGRKQNGGNKDDWTRPSSRLVGWIKTSVPMNQGDGRRNEEEERAWADPPVSLLVLVSPHEPQYRRAQTELARRRLSRGHCRTRGQRWQRARRWRQYKAIRCVR